MGVYLRGAGEGWGWVYLGFGLVQSFAWRAWVGYLEQIPSSVPTSAARRGNFREKEKRNKDYSHCINLQAAAGCNFLQFLAVKSKPVHFCKCCFCL